MKDLKDVAKELAVTNIEVADTDFPDDYTVTVEFHGNKYGVLLQTLDDDERFLLFNETEDDTYALIVAMRTAAGLDNSDFHEVMSDSHTYNLLFKAVSDAVDAVFNSTFIGWASTGFDEWAKTEEDAKAYTNKFITENASDEEKGEWSPSNCGWSYAGVQPGSEPAIF